MQRRMMMTAMTSIWIDIPAHEEEDEGDDAEEDDDDGNDKYLD